MGPEHYGEERAMTAEGRAEQLIAKELQRRRWAPAELQTGRRGDPGKVAPAAALSVEAPPAAPPAKVQAKPAPPKPVAASRPTPGTTLDGTWDRRLSRGLVSPDAIVDLHGHNLDTAWTLLDRRTINRSRLATGSSC